MNTTKSSFRKEQWALNTVIGRPVVRGSMTKNGIARSATQFNLVCAAKNGSFELWQMVVPEGYLSLIVRREGAWGLWRKHEIVQMSVTKEKVNLAEIINN